MSLAFNGWEIYLVCNQLSRAHRDSRRWKQQSGSLHGSVSGPLHMLGCVARCIYETLGSESEGVSDSFACSWDPFPPIVLPCPILVWVFVPSLFSTLLCCVHLASLRELHFSWKEMEEEWIWWRREVRGCGRSGRIGNCSWDVLCERIIQKRLLWG